MIRQMKHEDVPMLLTMCADMAAETDYKVDGFSYEKMEDLLDRVIRNESLLGLVSYQGNEIRGMFVGVLSEHFFSTKKIASDLFLYVVPEHRGKRDGYQLTVSFIQWAKEIGAEVIKMGITTKINEEKTAKLYKKLEFEYCGSVYKLRA